jgi:cytochrome c-type biogenesis protein CcmH/NrfG
MLAKDPNERYQSVHEIRTNLVRMLSSVDSVEISLAKAKTWRSIWLVVGAVLAVVVVLVLAVTNFHQLIPWRGEDAKNPAITATARVSYLKGRRLLQSNDRLVEAASYFLDAIRADPGYAPAYAGLARAQILPAFVGYQPLDELLPDIKRATETALAIDESLAETHAAIGLQKILEHDWLGAEQALRTAIELNPNHPDAYNFLSSVYLAAMGRLEEAISLQKKALHLDPQSVEARSRMGWCYYFERSFDEAIPYLRLALEKDPNHWASHWFLGCIYLQKRMYQEAVDEFALVILMDCPACPPRGGMDHPFVLASLGKKKQAIEVLKHTPPGKEYPELAYAALGETDQAFEWLQKHITQQKSGGRFSPFRLWLKVDPIWDPLREDPRFEDMIALMGFPE